MSSNNANRILIHKKGNAKERKNKITSYFMQYRSCLPTYKLTEPQEWHPINSQQLKEKAGFRNGNSTVDHIHVANLEMEGYSVHNKPFW